MNIDEQIRAIVREELARAGVVPAGQLSNGLRRANKSIVGQSAVMLRYIQAHPTTTTREAATGTFQPSLGYFGDWRRCVTQSVHDLKKRGYVTSLGRCYTITQAGVDYLNQAAPPLIQL